MLRLDENYKNSLLQFCGNVQLFMFEMEYQKGLTNGISSC